jgi:hypothetical protein
MLYEKLLILVHLIVLAHVVQLDSPGGPSAPVRWFLELFNILLLRLILSVGDEIYANDHVSEESYLLPQVSLSLAGTSMTLP